MGLDDFRSLPRMRIAGTPVPFVDSLIAVVSEAIDGAVPTVFAPDTRGSAGLILIPLSGERSVYHADAFAIAR